MEWFTYKYNECFPFAVHIKLETIIFLEIYPFFTFSKNIQNVNIIGEYGFTMLSGTIGIGPPGLVFLQYSFAYT